MWIASGIEEALGREERDVDCVVCRHGGSVDGLEVLGRIRQQHPDAVVVVNFGPDDWDRTFGTVDSMLDTGTYRSWRAVTAGASGLKLLAQYNRAKFRLRDHRYVQIREDEYAL